VQVDPVKPTLKAPGTKRLKLKYDEPPSNFAFKFNLHRYITALSEQRQRFQAALRRQHARGGRDWQILTATSSTRI